MSNPSTQSPPGKGKPEAAAEGPVATRTLFDLSGLDLTKMLRTRKDLEVFNPHRGHMALLDGVAWESQDQTRCIGVMHVKQEAFWVAGHFPGKPMMPGVIMIEAGAQLACYSWQVRQVTPHPIVAFLRIEQASFRSMVQPGDTMFILCQEVKFGRRRFISDVQGIVVERDGSFRITFDTRLSGMSIDPSIAPNSQG
jgi:3-hydroxyacyl-[acyl-carrier-protein] dehydratase